VGFSDEVLDVVLLGTGGSHLAVATNSMDIKLYSMKDMGCQLLRGHTDLVLSLAATPSNPLLLLSGAKVCYSISSEGRFKIVIILTFCYGYFLAS
jgi:U3 small nucleolar RNA-associated protein 13